MNVRNESQIIHSSFWRSQKEEVRFKFFINFNQLRKKSI
jgi:hypothetical protein